MDDPRHVVILGAPAPGSITLPPPPVQPGTERVRRGAKARRSELGTRRSGPPAPPPPLHGRPVRVRRRRRTPWPIPVMAVCCMTLVVVLQLDQSLPAPRFAPVVPAGFTVPGTPPALPWPALGQAAVSVPSTGMVLQSAPETPVPIASLAKIMTAYLVLRDHPVGAAAPGPAIAMTAADVADSAFDARTNATSIPVVAGEQFSERQLLDALIVHSANDVANSLARWDAGSLGAFVDEMNATAAALGMRQTHYVDASGIDQTGTSTAADQLRLTDAAMSIPAFAAVAAQPTITVAGAGTLANYVPAVGTDGVVGVKSGFTQAASGCVVLAAERTVAGKRVLVLAALTGQQGGVDPIRAATASAIALVDRAAAALQPETLLSPGVRVGTISAPWTTARVGAVTSAAVTTLAWPGDVVRFRLVVAPVHTGLRAGQTVAWLTVDDAGRTVVVPARATGAISAPSLHWRYVHH
ncbi:MAG: D-alanyl-D-alanine carboxypeptidase family protein [Acidimicrobiales bacterium]